MSFEWQPMEAFVSSSSAGGTVGIIVLAAGGSARMGVPKQLLLYRGQSLLRRAMETAVATVCRPMAMVLGANAERLCDEAKQLPVHVAENKRWEEGIGSSLQIGIETLVAADGGVEAEVIMLCDQPLVSARNINELVEVYRRTSQPIVASAYGETVGVPALFTRCLFTELAALKGSEGAKQIIAKHAHEVHRIALPAGAIDVDTPRDYEQLSSMTENTNI